MIALKHAVLVCTLLSSSIIAQAQKAIISGIVKDAATDQVIPNCVIYDDSTSIYTETNDLGFYELVIPHNKEITLVFSRLDYEQKILLIDAVADGERKKMDVYLSASLSNLEVLISESRLEQTGIIREGVTEFLRLPNTSGNLESVLAGTALGVNTGVGGELSAQYNVRGGNYDENLVYINDFEIYRPQLLQSSQQEGLTFANADLISTFTFSSGGFQAKYGDKLSSVLDLKYKKPEKVSSSVGLSLLGGSFHTEGKVPVGKKERPLRYVVGLRYKNTQSLLNSLDTQANYTANFGDLQGYFTYDFTPQLQIAFIQNTNQNHYLFIPTASTTIASGSKEEQLQFSSTFEGATNTRYRNNLGGLSLNYLPKSSKYPTYLKVLFSAYESEETNYSDVKALYDLYTINSMFNASNFGDILDTLASGTNQTFIDNQFTARITTLQHLGGVDFKKPSKKKTNNSHFLQWGLKYQQEAIQDTIQEWTAINSQGKTLPPDQEEVPPSTSVNSTLQLTSNRFNGFVQHTFTSTTRKREIQLTTGIRSGYWEVNDALFVTPRLQFLYDTKKQLSYRLATGLYYQSPFYRELRNGNGLVNTGVVPQKSWQVVGGIVYDFSMKKDDTKKFRLIAEAYYKKLWDLVSYDVDNVRITYAGENNARAYAAGLDVRVNGNFIPNAESWINLSFLRTRESIQGVQHKKAVINNPTGIDLKNVPRPNDRFMNLSIFFQDHFPRVKRLKTYLNYNFGTGLPYGLGRENIVFRNNFRYRATHQVNIGFSFSLWDHLAPHKAKHWLGFSKNAWLSLDVINLLNVRNVASNTLVPTADRQYVLPNYLTSRTANVRFRMEF